MIEAVADRLEGAPRQLRRRWSDEFKAQVVMALVDGMDWKRVRTAAVKPPEIVG
ncbi:hypothetical protein [Bradyrhizobium sp. USDA 4520]